jgi:hypothetical protein
MLITIPYYNGYENMLITTANKRSYKGYLHMPVPRNTYLNGDCHPITATNAFFTVLNTVIFSGKYRLNTGKPAITVSSSSPFPTVAGASHHIYSASRFPWPGAGAPAISMNVRSRVSIQAVFLRGQITSQYKFWTY